MAIKAIIWDMGGVLVRTEDYGPRTALAARFGMSCSELERVVFNSRSAQQASLGVISGEEHWRNVAAFLSAPAEQAAELEREFFAGDRLDEKCVAYIRSLRPRLKTGLLSNAFSNIRRSTEEAYHYLDAFDTSVFSAEVGLIKPDARIYQYILGQMEVQPAEAVFVDDFIANVTGALEAGMQAVHFRNTDQVLKELHKTLAADEHTGS